MTNEVRETLGANIARIRGLRGMTVRDLSTRLQQLGLRLSPSGVSEIEATPQKKARRKVSVDELLIIAIALNASVIDLLMPADGSDLAVADGVLPVDARHQEQWLRGETVWPPAWLEWSLQHPGKKLPPEVGKRFTAQNNEFLAATSDARERVYRRGLRSELSAIGLLHEHMWNALDALEGAKDEMPPPQMAQQLREDLEEVSAYVKLLAKKLDKKETWNDQG